MAGDTQLSKLTTRPDPMLTFRWLAKYVPFSELGPIDASFVESFELPFSNVKSDGVFYGGGYAYFPQFHDTSAFNVNFYSDAEGRALRYLWAWKQKVKSFETGLYNLPTEFKEDWVAVLLNAKGKEIAEFTFVGCWPADTGQISLDYNDGSSRIVLNQNFSVDSVTIKV